MKSSISIFLIALAFMLQSASCNKVKELEYKGVKSTKLETLSFSKAAIRINLEYYNPNTFGIDVKQTNLNVYLNDKFIGIADQPEKTQIPKSSNFIFPIVAHFDPLKVIGTAISSLFSQTNKITIQGSAKLGKGGMYITVPIDVTESVNILK